jgi:hypothetical protein
MSGPLTAEAHRLALAASLTRQARRLVAEPADDERLLIDGARRLAAVAHPRVRFDPHYPGVGKPERAGGRARLVLACTAYGDDGEIGTVFTTLIAGRPPAVSVAPPGTPHD